MFREKGTAAYTASRARRGPSGPGRSPRIHPHWRSRSAAGSVDAAGRNPTRARPGRWRSLRRRLPQAVACSGQFEVRAKRHGGESEHGDAEGDRLERRGDELGNAGTGQQGEADRERTADHKQRTRIARDQQTEPQRDLEDGGRRDERGSEIGRHPGPQGEVDLARRREELRNDPVVQPDERDCASPDPVNDAAIERSRRVGIALQPEPEAVEAPRGRPAEQRTEHQVQDSPGHTESRLVVVLRNEPSPAEAWYVAPVTRSLGDEGLAIVGPEAQRRRAIAVAFRLAHAFAFASDAHAESDARRVQEALGFSVGGAR